MLRPEGILFVGDHLLPKITPHVGIYPNGPQNPLGDFLAPHEKTERVDARLVCPAHGGVYEDHRRRAIAQEFEHVEPGQLRHLNVEKHEIRRQLFDQLHRFDAVRRLTDDLNVRDAG